MAPSVDSPTPARPERTPNVMRRSYLLAAALLAACTSPAPHSDPEAAMSSPDSTAAASPEERLEKYTPVRLTTDLAELSESERRMIPLLIDAARAMDAIYWVQAYGNRDSLLASIRDPRHAALRGDQLRPLGPAGRRRALRPRRRARSRRGRTSTRAT